LTYPQERCGRKGAFKARFRVLARFRAFSCNFWSSQFDRRALLSSFQGGFMNERNEC
jgi:hypothetical protein